jgi:hypothetical protein
MAARRTTHCVVVATLSQAIDVAGGVLMADVFFAVPEPTGSKNRKFLRFIPEFAECLLVGCAPVRW